MSNVPKTIYRRHPEHAGTKPVMRSGSPMLTMDVQRLRNASPLQTVRPVRRRALSKRTVILSFLLCVLVVIVALAIATSEGRAAHAQSAVISAPCLKCVYLPMVQR